MTILTQVELENCFWSIYKFYTLFFRSIFPRNNNNSARQSGGSWIGKKNYVYCSKLARVTHDAIGIVFLNSIEMFLNFIELQNVLLTRLLNGCFPKIAPVLRQVRIWGAINAVAQKSIRRSHCTHLSLIGGVIAVISRVMVTTKLVPRGQPLYVRRTMKMRNGWWGGSHKKKKRKISIKITYKRLLASLRYISVIRDKRGEGLWVGWTAITKAAGNYCIGEQIKVFVPLFIHSRAYIRL